MYKDKKETASEGSEAELFGLDEETSLMSVNFATTQNKLLNEELRDENQE